MLVSLRLKLVAAAVVVLSQAVPSAACAAGPALEVHVADSRSKQAVRLARIVLSGAESSIGYTDRGGTASFDTLPAGRYTVRVARAGYVAASAPAVELTDDRQTEIDVDLTPLGELKQIGSVTARSSLRISTTDLAGASPLERLSGGSLAQALGDDGEFSLRDGLLSIDGHDPTQTGLAIDGVQVGGFGVPADLRGLNLDLFNGSSVSPSSTTALAGTLNMVTLEPTVLPETSSTLSSGSLRHDLWRSWARGTIGQIGIVASHVSTGLDSPLDGRTFLDGSGLTYPHQAASRSQGDLVKLRAPLSKSDSLTLTALSSSTTRDASCERISGPVACGVGPGNAFSSNTDLGILKYEHDGERLSMSLSAVEQRARFDQDLSHRFTNGVADPAFDSGLDDVGSLSAAFRLAGLGTTTSLNLSATRVRFAQQIGGAFSQAGAVTASLIDGALTHQVQLSDALQLTESLTYQRNFVDRPFGAGLSAFWRPTKRDTVRAAARVQNGGAAQILSGSLRDPASLLYDCPGHAVFGTALGDTPTASSVTDTSVDWNRRGALGSVSLSLGRQVQRGTSVSTIVNGLDQDLPPDYLSAVDRFYATPAGCGASTALTPANLYFTTSVAAVNRRYQTARLGFSRQFGRSVALGGYARFTDARITGNDPRLVSPFSVTIPGRQLPNVPRWRGGLVVDTRAPRSPLELLAYAQYVGRNNERNLPAYATLSLGAGLDLKHGTLTLSETNVTNAFAGSLTSPLYAVPLPLAGGGVLPTLAQPLPGRAFALTYTLHTGLRKARTVDAGNLESGGEEPSVAFKPLPQQPPEDAFAPDRADPNCKPERLADATHVLDALRAASVEIERARSASGGYPDAVDLSRFATDDVRFAYHRTGSSYAISLQLPTPFALGISCVSIAAAGELADAQSAGAYTDLGLPPRALEYAYMPRFGVYVVFHQGVLLKSAVPPATADSGPRPADPLSTRTACPLAERPLVGEIVAAVRATEAATGPASRRLDNGTVIEAVSGALHRTVRIAFPDPIARTIFEGCVYVSPVGPAAAKTELGVTLPDEGAVYFSRPGGFITVVQ
jgi:hypothetical protein